MNDQEISNTQLEEEQGESSVEEQIPIEETQEVSEETTPSVNAKIVIKKDEETVMEYTIEDVPVNIGRKGNNQIVLEEKNVSRKHAQIVMKEDQYFIEDLGSTGGTSLNGEKISQKDIHTGDIIEIGSYKLYFDSGIPEDERTILETEEETVLEEGTVVDEDRTMFYEEPEAKLVVVKSETLDGEIVLDGEDTVLGRDENVGITVEDKRVSREHCKIYQEGENFIISDLGSSNGTFVNGQKIAQKILENRDRIQIGSNIFEFRIEKPELPRKRSGVRILFKTLFGIVILAGISFVIYKVVPALRTGKAQKVILQSLWEYPANASVAASPSLGDLNGDGYINMVAADMNGVIYALDGRQGGLVWNSEFSSTGGAIVSSPLLADINEKDGKLDVVVGTANKGVLAIDGGTMRQIWVGRVGSEVFSTPAGADINGDGTNDVFVGTKQGMIICLDGRQGGAVWKVETNAPIKTSPVLADLNNDDVPDVIIGSANARLYALNGKNGTSIWIHTGSDELSTAACADINEDKVPDVAVVTPSEIIVLEGRKGSVLWTWSIPKTARPTEADPFLPFPPAVSDINGDKKLDVIISTSKGHVYAVDGASKGVKYIWDFGLTPARKTGPALCDFNGDRINDIAVGDSEGNLIIIDGKTGHKLNSLNFDDAIISTPVIGDFTSDGTVDIAVGTKGKKIIAIQTETVIKKNKIVWNSF